MRMHAVVAALRRRSSGRSAAALLVAVALATLPARPARA